MHQSHAGALVDQLSSISKLELLAVRGGAAVSRKMKSMARQLPQSRKLRVEEVHQPIDALAASIRHDDHPESLADEDVNDEFPIWISQRPSGDPGDIDDGIRDE